MPEEVTETALVPRSALLPPVVGTFTPVELHLDRLAKETPKKEIRRHPKGFDYTEWRYHAEQLDELVGKGNWAFEVTSIEKATFYERRKKRGEEVEEQVEEIIVHGYLLAGIPGQRVPLTQGTGGMVRRQDMAYSKAYNGARSLALKRATIEALGIGRDLEREVEEAPTADQIEAARNTFQTIREQLGDDKKVRAALEKAGLGHALDAEGNLDPEKLTREQLGELNTVLAELLTAGLEERGG